LSALTPNRAAILRTPWCGQGHLTLQRFASPTPEQCEDGQNDDLASWPLASFADKVAVPCLEWRTMYTAVALAAERKQVNFVVTTTRQRGIK
jgi:hypothetical protein